LAGGAYDVTVTDANNCTETFTVGISEAGAPSIVLNSTSITCNGDDDGTIGVNASGGLQPYSYSWTHGSSADTLSGLAPGTYTVTVSGNDGCDAVGTVDIIEPDVLTAYTITTIAVGGNCVGTATAVANGGTPAYTYQWGASAGSQTTATAHSLCQGSYNVQITDANGCNTIVNATVDTIVGIQDNTLNHITEFRIFPNPVNGDQLYIQYQLDKSMDISIMTYDSQGKLVNSIQRYYMNNGQEAIDISDLSSGLYLLRLRIGSELIGTHKFQVIR